MLSDLRLALRTLSRARGFALAALATLALGISVNTTIFSLVSAVLLSPPPFARSGRVVALYAERPTQGVTRASVAYPDAVDWRARSRALDAIAVIRHASVNLATSEGVERLESSRVSAEFFRIFGVSPALGRTFAPGEDRADAPRTVVLSHALWQSRFGADPRVLGRALTLDGEPYTVIGVMPAAFGYPTDAELWTSYVPDADALDRNNRFLRAVGRLAPGTTLDVARRELGSLAASLAAEHPASNRDTGVELVPLRETLVGGWRDGLLALEGAVALVLLIACANVANLLLGRVAARTREMAVRLALGATRARLVRQLVAESVVLALVASALGALFAVWQVRLVTYLASSWIPPWAHPAVDGRVLAFTIVLATATGVLFGLAPALHASSAGARTSLAESARTHTAGRGRLQRSLVVAEVALSLVLAASAAGLVDGLIRLTRTPPGFDPSGVLVARVSLARNGAGKDAEHMTAFADAALERIRSLPGVRVAGATTELPLAGATTSAYFRIDGRPEPEPGAQPVAAYQSVTPDYFGAMRIPIRRGRAFTPRDDERAAPVAIVNEAFARRHFPGEDPIGHRIGSSERWVTIVGVAGDVRHESLDVPAEPTYFFPLRQSPTRQLTLVARTQVDPASLVSAVRAAVRGVDASTPLFGITTLDATVARTLDAPRLGGTMLGAFAVISLALTAIGLYGVIALGVAQRRRELAVRVALGAQRRDLLRLVVGEGARLTGIGIAVGALAAVLMARVLAARLPGVRGAEPALILGVAALLGAIALVASWIPARRAANAEAMGALSTGD
jgi:putative ABC transport system permease protein